jgi:hypothetical protein
MTLDRSFRTTYAPECPRCGQSGAITVGGGHYRCENALLTDSQIQLIKGLKEDRS